MRIKLTIEYDGTHYCGWQRQPNGVTIQETLEKELYKLTGEMIALHGSGRTDSGVHAFGQVAHFDTSSRIPPEKFCYALNTGLPRDIRVQASESVPDDFHARFGAKAKHYRYTMRLAPHAGAINRNFELHIHEKLDIDAMRKAAQLIAGKHDFASFAASGSAIEDTTRVIYRSELASLESYLIYDIIGNGFLYNMVRIIVGTLLHIGKNSLPPDHMQSVIAAKNRAAAADTAPAKGLALMEVFYDVFL